MLRQNKTWVGTAQMPNVGIARAMATKWRRCFLPRMQLADGTMKYTARSRVIRAVTTAVFTAVAMLANETVHAYSCETLKPVLTITGVKNQEVMATTSAVALDPSWSQATITISVAKPGKENWIRVVVGKPKIHSGSQGPNISGTLTRINATTYQYTAPAEPFWQVYPDENAKIPVYAKIGSTLCSTSRRPIVVHSVFEGLRNFAPEHRKYWMMYDYVNAKYAGVLATTRGLFTNVTIPFSGKVLCLTWTGWKWVPACTTGKDVVFGTDSFFNENLAASVIGHELVHTTGVSGECPSYLWEFDHRAATGVNKRLETLRDLMDSLTDHGCW